MKKQWYFVFFLVNILLKRDVHAANNKAFCALYNYDMHAQITAGVDRAYKDTVTFAPGEDNEDGNPTCARTDFTDTNPRPCDCSDANSAMPTASSGFFLIFTNLSNEIPKKVTSAPDVYFGTTFF